MKKILYSVFMLATMVLAACSSEDTTEPDVKRGMVLKANVGVSGNLVWISINLCKSIQKELFINDTP